MIGNLEASVPKKHRTSDQHQDEAAEIGDEVVLSMPPSPLHSNEDETRKKFLKYGLPLYQAAMEGDWDIANSIFAQDPDWIIAPITKRNDTTLHIAAAAMHLEFITKLVDRMVAAPVHDRLESQNILNNTAFCIAASSGNVGIAKIMVAKNSNLPNIKGSTAKILPLHMAILLGHENMVQYLKDVTNYDLLDDYDRVNLLTSAIDADLYGFNMGKDERKQNLELALQVTQRAWNEVIKLSEDKISDLIGYPSRLLFDAAEVGNVEFLVTLIRSYPDVIWKVDEKSRSIFHIAVECRHEKIFKLIHEIGAIKDLIAAFTDEEQNNMLHLAAKIAPPNRLNCVSGAALQMQRELLWFKAVKDVVQPNQAMAKNNPKDKNYNEMYWGNTMLLLLLLNKKNESKKTPQTSQEAENKEKDNPQNAEQTNKSRKTPQALFTEEHKNLRLEGEEWMKKTAESCTLVATLIATVVFTAAFTLPGGNDDKDGSPILLKQAAFKVFAISNAVSLFASATSILMFLSILTSRYAERDFITILPLKLMIGLFSLFLSIATMMVAFTSTFFITFKNDSIWIPAPIALLAAIPVLLFAFLQYPLLWDIFSSTYRSSTLFKPNKPRKLSWKSKGPKAKLS